MDDPRPGRSMFADMLRAPTGPVQLELFPPREAPIPSTCYCTECRAVRAYLYLQDDPVHFLNDRRARCG